MFFSSWLRTLISSQSRNRRFPRTAPKSAGFRPRLEALDDRLLPSTLSVATNLDSGTGSLRADIAAAKSGDTIDLSALAGQTIGLTSGELVINKNLTIEGPSSSLSPVTISPTFSLSGYSYLRIFEVDGAKTSVAMSNLAITGGEGVANNAASAGAVDGQGGAIWNAGKLTLTNCTLDNNSSIPNAPTLQGGAGGGAIWNGGTLTLNSCTLDNNSDHSGNESTAFGGAIYNAGTLTVSNSTLSGNTVGIWSFEVSNGGNGGAIYNAGTLTVSNSTLSGNTAYEDGDNYGNGYGGGIFNALKASATVTGGSVSGNNAQHDGGGIYNDGTLTLIGNTLTGNIANDGLGGGIFNDKKGHLAIQSASSVVNNYAYDLYDLGVTTVSNDSHVGVTFK